MTVYLTKVWGFDVPRGPLQFSMEGRRNSAREQLVPGTLVILVGTKTDNTAEEDRGRILGMMEPTTEIVLSLDFDLPQRQNDFNEKGEIKWPYG